MTIGEAIGIVALGLPRTCDKGVFKDMLLARAEEIIQSNRGHLVPAGMVLGAYSLSPGILAGRIEGYRQQYLKPKPEWFCLGDRTKVGLHGIVEIVAREDDAAVLIGHDEYRIRGEPPLEGHRLIIEQRREDEVPPDQHPEGEACSVCGNTQFHLGGANPGDEFCSACGLVRPSEPATTEFDSVVCPECGSYNFVRPGGTADKYLCWDCKHWWPITEPAATEGD